MFVDILVNDVDSDLYKNGTALWGTSKWNPALLISWSKNSLIHTYFNFPELCVRKWQYSIWQEEKEVAQTIFNAIKLLHVYNRYVFNMIIIILFRQTTEIHV